MSTLQDDKHALIYLHGGDWYYLSWRASGEILYDQFLTAGSKEDNRADLWRFVELDDVLGSDFEARAVSFAYERPDEPSYAGSSHDIIRKLVEYMGTAKMADLFRTLAGLDASISGMTDAQRQVVSDASRALRS